MGKSNGGDGDFQRDITAARVVIGIVVVAGFCGLLYVLNHVSGGAVQW